MKNKKIIFIALDCSVSRAKLIIKSIPKLRNKKYIFGLKIGYQIFYSEQGRDFIKSIKGFPIFLDLKLHDIENTIANAMRSLGDIKNIDYITIPLAFWLIKEFLGVDTLFWSFVLSPGNLIPGVIVLTFTKLLIFNDSLPLHITA